MRFITYILSKLSSLEFKNMARIYTKTDEWMVTHHFLEMNRYIRLAKEFRGESIYETSIRDTHKRKWREEPSEVERIVNESAQDYIENHLPGLSQHFREVFGEKISKRFDRKREELERAYSSD
jgi:hypothetical protein